MDVDKLISDVLQWQSTMESISKERNILLMENNSMKSTIANLSSSERDAQQQNAALKESLKALQDSFLRRYDYKEECQRLREEITKGEEETKSERNLLQKKIRDLEMAIASMKEENMEKIEDLNGKWKLEVRNLEQKLRDESSKWQDKADEEMRRCEEVDRVKDGEIMKMKIEYEGKFKRIQEQHTKLQNKASSNATGNDIFRKKLQHEREISARKVRDLENEIEDLKKKVATRDTSQSFISGYNRHITNTARPVASSFKRRKPN